MPDALGHYKIIDQLGAGGLSEVYRAKDTRLGRTVAIKVLPAELVADAPRLERLLQAARAAAELSHPNIAALFDIGEEGATRYLVFEYVPGTPLSAVIHGRPLNVRRAVEFAIELADALAEAEASGILHGDVRPDRIVITPKERAKFLSFGLAAFTTGGADRQAYALHMGPAARLPIAIALYLSPEEVAARPPEARSEIFSLGSVIFEMVTGRPPFRGDSSAAILQQIARSQAPPPSTLNAVVPSQLDAVVRRALATNIENRYQTAATMAADLREVSAILTARAERAEADFEPRPAASSHKGRIIAAVVAVAIVLAACWSWRNELRQLWQRVAASPVPLVIAGGRFGRLQNVEEPLCERRSREDFVNAGAACCGDELAFYVGDKTQCPDARQLRVGF